MAYKETLFDFLGTSNTEEVTLLGREREPLLDMKYSANRYEFLLGESFNYDAWVNKISDMALDPNSNVREVASFKTRRPYVRVKIQGEYIWTVMLYKPTPYDPRVMTTRRI